MAPKERREAKADREAAAKAEQDGARKKQEEDAYWAAAGEGEKSKAGKKKESLEASKAEAAAKKAEAKRLAEEEERELANTGKRGGKVAPAKVTAAQLAVAAEQERKRREDAAEKAKKAARKEVSEDAYDALVSSRNVNREAEAVDARNLDSALVAIQSLALSEGGAEGGDKHPEKRMKAAWAAYEAAELPGLQEQKPGLKRQQYRDLLWKSWQKAPQNPMNARGSSAGLSSMGEPPSSDDE